MTAAVLALVLSAAPAPALVEAADVVPGLVVEMRYATPDNFLGRAVYPQGARCLLLPEAAERLKAAAERLQAQGFRLKVYDCYRPLSVQRQMWKLFPKPGYVANPKYGSNHNRGAAVDLTLVDATGAEVEMPTAYDTFSRAAHHGYANASAPATRHRALLREAMERAGFKKNRMEWWHYDLPDARKHPVRDDPL